MTDTPESIDRTARAIAQQSFAENNPTILQFYFQSMSPTDVRDLLNWTDDPEKWKPKVYPEDRSPFRLVAECMLRYYYYPFEPTDEDSPEPSADFFERKEYWSKISIDGTLVQVNTETTSIKHHRKRHRRNTFSYDDL